MPNNPFRWSHFRDLPEDVSGLTDPEIATLARVWLEQKGSLEESGLVAAFTERLIREYAIEGGIIERAYTLDRGITQLLIDRGIDASLIPRNKTDKDPQRVARIIQAHQSVVEGIFDLVKGGRSLTVSVIKEMHAALLQHETEAEAIDGLGRLVYVPLVKGAYKTLPNNPLRQDGSMHEYCPPEHVASEMDRLIELHGVHEKKGVPVELEAAWLHHAFTQIHPFQDGNGRIARLIASYVFIKGNYFPLTLISDQDRDAYIAALETADKQWNLQPLVRLFSQVQRRTFVRVLGIAGHLQQHGGVDQIISAVRRTITLRKVAHAEQLEKAKRTARTLQAFTVTALEEVVDKLRTEIGPLSPSFQFRVDSESDEGARRHYFRGQIIEAAKSLGYFANVGVYHDWARLILRTDDQSEVLVSFHGIGHEYRGVLAASVAFYRRVATENSERETTEAIVACENVFQVNYIEEEDTARTRFGRWLREAITKALEMWRTAL